MAQADNDPLDIRGFEDSNALEKIADMIMDRVSVLGTVYETGSGASDRIRHYRNLHCNMESTLIDKVQFIRECILDLAPYFVDMDYPYWNHCWATFPQFYSANQINMDEEHNLNVLPTYFCSFDRNTMGLYSKFLDNAVYWLRKFRYTRAKTTFADKIFRQKWSYMKYWDGTGSCYRTDATGQREYDLSFTIDGLRSYAQGYVWDENVSGDTNGEFTVSCEESRNVRKRIDTPGRWEDLPLQNHDPEHDNYEREMRNIPGTLTVKNPSGYYAEALWFIVNLGNGSTTHSDRKDNFWVKSLHEYTVTAVEQSQEHTWGSQSQFHAYDYSATKATEMNAGYQSHRNDYKEIEYTMHGETTTEHRLTNWTDDGTRSYVKEDTITQTGPWSPASSEEDRTVSQNMHPLYGLVPFDSGSRPCFSAGMAEPHGNATYEVCTQNSLVLPTWEKVPISYIDNNYMFGITEWSSCRYYGSTKWVPILDFGDYLTELPEETGE